MPLKDLAGSSTSSIFSKYSGALVPKTDNCQIYRLHILLADVETFVLQASVINLYGSHY